MLTLEYEGMDGLSNSLFFQVKCRDIISDWLNWLSCEKWGWILTWCCLYLVDMWLCYQLRIWLRLGRMTQAWSVVVALTRSYIWHFQSYGWWNAHKSKNHRLVLFTRHREMGRIKIGFHSFRAKIEPGCCDGLPFAVSTGLNLEPLQPWQLLGLVQCGRRANKAIFLAVVGAIRLNFYTIVINQTRNGLQEPCFGFCMSHGHWRFGGMIWSFRRMDCWLWWETEREEERTQSISHPSFPSYFIRKQTSTHLPSFLTQQQLWPQTPDFDSQSLHGRQQSQPPEEGTWQGTRAERPGIP